MSKAPPLPPIDSELTPAPRQRLDLKNLKPRGVIADEAVEANSMAIGQKWGASKQLPVAEEVLQPAPTATARAYMPEYLLQELAVKAANRRVSMSYLILEALSQTGYRVDPVDLIGDRRRLKAKKGT